MAYCTPEDVTKVMSRRTLIELTNDPVERSYAQPLPDTINDTVLDDAIRYADELIDAHLRGRYTLPLTHVPTVLRDLSVNLVCQRLYVRRPQGDLPDVVKEVHRGSLRTLEAIRDNKLTLGVQTTQTDMPESGEFRVRTRRTQFGGRHGLLEKY